MFYYTVILVPIFSPNTALFILSSSLSPNKSIGILFSIAKTLAAKSITPNLSSTILEIGSSSYFFASGFLAGSLSYTPSMAFAPKIQSASIKPWSYLLRNMDVPFLLQRTQPFHYLNQLLLHPLRKALSMFHRQKVYIR